MDFRCVISCLLVNLKRNSLPHILAAAALTATVPLVFSLTSLTAPLAAQPLEMYLSLIGMLLMTPIFLPEQSEEIRDTVRVRKMPYLAVCGMRLIYLCAFIMVFCGVVVALLAAGESAVTVKHFIGALSTALFLGSIGIFGSAASGNAVIGYMASMLYFVSNFYLKTRLGVFYLFGMSFETGISKIWLLGGAAVLTAASFAYLKYIKKID